MCHVAAVLARQSYQCSFDERAYAGDLPQDRLAPRHEPISDGLSWSHAWPVLLRATYCNKNNACDNILCRRRFQPLFSRCFAVYSASRKGSKVRRIRFLRGWWIPELRNSDRKRFARRLLAAKWTGIGTHVRLGALFPLLKQERGHSVGKIRVPNSEFRAFLGGSPRRGEANTE